MIVSRSPGLMPRRWERLFRRCAGAIMPKYVYDCIQSNLYAYKYYVSRRICARLLRPRIEGGAVVDKQFSSSCGCDTENPDDPHDDQYDESVVRGSRHVGGREGSSRPDNVATIALDILAQTGVFRDGRLVGGSDVFVSNVREPLTPFTNALTMTGTREDTECAMDKINAQTNTCLDNKTLGAIESFVKSKGVEVADQRDVIKKAKEVTECDGETCVLRKHFLVSEDEGD